MMDVTELIKMSRGGPPVSISLILSGLCSLRAFGKRSETI